MLENAMRVFQCVSVVSLILSLSVCVWVCVCPAQKKQSIVFVMAGRPVPSPACGNMSISYSLR